MKGQNIFPDLSKQTSTSLESQSIVLNGQKVLFDKKVILIPVELREKKRQNGQPNR